MSIVLKDGTVLPDIPSEVLAEFPCVMIANIGNTGFAYAVYLCAVPFFYVSAAMIGSNVGAIGSLSATKVGSLSMNMEDWNIPNSTTDTLTLYENYAQPVWSNHDILEVVDVNYETLEFTYADEPYFPNSLAQPKPPFILPDGTELPALPDGWSEGTPYGFATLFYRDETNEIYSFFAMAQPSVGLPYDLLPDDWKDFFEEVAEYLCLPPGAYKQWNCQTKGSGEEPSWLLVDDMTDDMAFPITPVDATPWVNHDTLRLTSFSADGTSYTIGSEIARKSDENYRITGGYMTSIANEARRLGGVSGALTPAAMETALRGAE